MTVGLMANTMTKTFDFLETNDMTAGQGGVNSGYDLGIIGALTPLTFLGTGNLVEDIGYNVGLGGDLVVALRPVGLGAGLWTRIAFSSVDSVWNRKEYLAADAVYSDSVGTDRSVWTFALPSQALFLDGVTYLVDWV